MKKWWINGLCTFLAGALAIVAVGCGDDKGNDSATELTKEEQYDLVQPLIATAPNLVVQNFGTQFLDGVDTADFVFNLLGLGKIVPPRLGKLLPGALAKPMQVEADTLILGYNTSNGWWTFHVEYSLDIDTLGLSLDLTLSLDDSVRFETEAGQAQFDPNGNTYRLRHEGSSNLSLLFDGDTAGVFGVDLGGDNDFDIVGLNGSQVTINGSTDAAIDFEFSNDTIEAAIEMSYSGEADDVVTDNEPESCPESGNLTLDFEMDFDVTRGDENVTVSGDWEVRVELLGDNMANVEVQSGDFEAEGVQDICEEPL